MHLNIYIYVLIYICTYIYKQIRQARENWVVQSRKEYLRGDIGGGNRKRK
jgi:hypothetical protein